MSKQNTSGMVLTSFRSGTPAPPSDCPTEMDDLVADESADWQAMSNIAADAANNMMPSLIRRTYKLNGVTHELPKQPVRVPQDPNRVLEIHGLMGAIGEQIGLALTADLDARRLMAEAQAESDKSIEYRLRIRAVSEMSAYFTLGAAHSTANLTLRFLLLYPDRARMIDPKGEKYRPGDDGRDAWATLNGLAKTFRSQAETADKGALRRLITAVIDLQSSADFKALDERRGMDFHRRRPQSVEHSAPTAGVYTSADGTATLRMPALAMQPEANASAVHAVAQAGLHRVAQSMRIVRTEFGPALRDEGFTYIW